jgi:hypothetical protein
MKPLQNVLIAALCVFSILQSAFGQGSLTPPGPPTAGMLTLSQVEPRTPVDAIHTPGNGTSEFVINSPGSYYLTTNILGVSAKDGIAISTNNVRLDLNGFSLMGASGGFNVGIRIVAGTNVTVLNGAISGWSADGLYSLGNNVTLEHLSVSDNAAYGILVENPAAIRYCLTTANRDIGIAVFGNDCLVQDNVSSADNSGNTSGFGGLMILGNDNRIENNHVTGAGVAGYGIAVYNNGPYTNNIIIRNSVEGNGTNDYGFILSQVVGPLITNTVSGIITNSNPWANFAS